MDTDNGRAVEEVRMKRFFYALAIIALALGIASPYVWRWYWYHTAKLAMRRI